MNNIKMQTSNPCSEDILMKNLFLTKRSKSMSIADGFFQFVPVIRPKEINRPLSPLHLIKSDIIHEDKESGFSDGEDECNSTIKIAFSKTKPTFQLEFIRKPSSSTTELPKVEVEFRQSPQYILLNQNLSNEFTIKTRDDNQLCSILASPTPNTTSAPIQKRHSILKRLEKRKATIN